MFSLRTTLSRTSAVARNSTSSARAFSVRAALRGGPESDIHNPNRAEELEKHKQEQLAAQKAGKGEWKPELSSDSENFVKADKHAPEPSKENLDKLQKETAQHAKDKHGH